jgi:hypothetical protein
MAFVAHEPVAESFPIAKPKPVPAWPTQRSGPPPLPLDAPSQIAAPCGPASPASSMSRETARALGKTVKIAPRRRARHRPGVKAFAMGALLGAVAMFALASSDRVHDARVSLANALRGMKSQSTAMEQAPVYAPVYAPPAVEPAPAAPASPATYGVPAAAEPSPYATPPAIPTWDVRDLPRVPRPGQRAIDEVRPGDEASNAPEDDPTKRAIFRPEPVTGSVGQKI